MHSFDTKMELLRIATAGSVDDGKSTLIGRLLYDCGGIYEDQLESIRKASLKRGDSEIDLSLLTDGLSAEREQKITIDVAHIHLSTPKRKFIIADVPGHEQYTRNMITGASNADMALILVDARNGMLIQSKRHLFISALMGIRHILIVVNKMDLVDYSREVFEKIKNDFIDFAAKLDIYDLQFIPVSALMGDMVVERGSNLDWYKGPALLDYLENLQIASDRNLIDFRFPVQCVIRPNQNFRGYAGRIESGVIKKGQDVLVLPSGSKTKIKSIISNGKELDYAFNPQSALLILEDEVDASRGDMIVPENNLPEVGNEFEATLCWMSDQPLEISKSYIIKHGPKTCKCLVRKIRYRINVDTLHREKTDTLRINEIGRVFVRTNDVIMFDSYRDNKSTGCFIIIDITTNNTIGSGVIVRGVKQKEIKKTDGAVLWFTGLSGAGKTTIANKVVDSLRRIESVRCEHLDGDMLRENLCRDLGFSKEDRDKNIERAAYVAGLLSRHGVLVLASFISPYKSHRLAAREQASNFVEIFVNAPIEICEQRDVKGLYKKARSGEIENFTGVNDSYEAPENHELELRTDKMSADECAEIVLNYLNNNNFI